MLEEGRMTSCAVFGSALDSNKLSYIVPQAADSFSHSISILRLLLFFAFGILSGRLRDRLLGSLCSGLRC